MDTTDARREGRLQDYFVTAGRVSPASEPAPPWRANLQFGDINTDWSEIDTSKVSEREKKNLFRVDEEIGKHRWWMSLLPGGIYTTTKMFGGKYLLRSAWNMFVAYSKTAFSLYRKYGATALRKFMGTKLFVPVGEGAGAAAYFLAGPLIRRFPALAPLPRWVEIEITTICNKKCTHCEHTHWGITQEQRHLTLEEYRHIIDQFDLTWVHTTGEGSSFLNPDFFGIMEENRKRNIPHYFVDHFDDLTEKDMDEILKRDVAGIYISIDGASPETYNPVRIGCDFDRVVRNIRKFIEKKKAMGLDLPELNFRMVVTNDNVHEMPRFVDLVKSFGGAEAIGRGARLDFVGVLNFDENEQNFVNTVPYDIYRETIEKARTCDFNVIMSHIEPTQNPPSSQCICWLEPYILMGGDVIPCCTVLMSNNREYLHSSAFGNVFTQSFREIWESRRYREFRSIINDDTKPVPGFCVNCRGYDNSRRALKNGIRWDL
ncbi:MAG: radical SAM protein [Alphaproteobacteria bacterium]|uniref:Radical SAM protein n=1 Tax=Candidatus Nitrobium versatile TaxID=2884831 RepID=A0A953J724_9BACT|nr:radical SAM protein [Candidatus Nitrobium versatile]